MVIGDPVFLKLPLVAAGGGQRLSAQGQNAQLPLPVGGVPQGDAPGAASVPLAQGGNGAGPQVQKGGVHLVVLQQIQQAVGGVTLGDAAQVHGHAGSRQAGRARPGVHIQRGAVHQGQEYVQFRLRRDVVVLSCAAEPPGVHDGGDGAVEGPAGGLITAPAQLQQLQSRAVQGHKRSVAGVGVEAGDVALRLVAVQEPVQAAQLPDGGLQGLLRLRAGDLEVHERIHGEQGALGAPSAGGSARCGGAPRQQGGAEQGGEENGAA